MIKRCIDFSFSLLGLVILSPLLLIIVVATRLCIGSPVLFEQSRPGLHARPFKMNKFRTMTNDCDAEGNLLDDEQRLLRFGRFMRSSSLDELPELINVLKGDMSLVGPRPLLMEYLPLYSTEQAQRHEVRPGITGWAQINGRNAISWDEKFKYDIWYVNNHTVWFDLKIIFLTLTKVFKREGISQDGQATMEKFQGSKKNEV